VDAQPIEQDALLRRAEVAAILCVGPKTVARWAKAGKLNSFRTPGGHRRYLKADVFTLMSGVNPGGDRVPLLLVDDSSASIPARYDGMIPVARRDPAATRLDPCVAAAVVSGAVALARETQADEAAKAAIATADAVAAAATTESPGVCRSRGGRNRCQRRCPSRRRDSTAG
jgi:excisionase family DNA binding protein